MTCASGLQRSVRGDQRGLSVSVFAAVISAALVITTGLVVDGGQKVTAAARAEAAADGAARAAANAAATQSLAGSGTVVPAVRAARAFLAGDPEVTGTVDVRLGVVTVRTQATAETVFLSVIGVGSVTGRGLAAANIVSTGRTR